MNFIVSLYNTGAYRNVSDYVISCDDIPYIDRNRDYTLRASTFNLIFSDTITYVPAPNDKIKIEYSSTTVFIGRVIKAPHSRIDRTYATQIISRTEDLQDYLVDWDTLQAEIIENARITADDKVNSTGNGSFLTTRTYWAEVVDPDNLNIYTFDTTELAYKIGEINVVGHGYSLGDEVCFFSSGGTDYISKINKDLYTGGDNESVALATNLENAKITYLLNLMFTLAGFTLTDSYSSQIIGNFTKGGIGYDYTCDDFRIDVSALYAANQGGVMDGRQTKGDGFVFQDSKITFFDFISIVAKSMSLIIVPTGDDEYTMYKGDIVGEIYTISDDYLYEYTDTPTAGAYFDYSFIIYYGQNAGNLRPAYYQTSVLTSYAAVNDGAGNQSVSWYSNIAFLFKDQAGSVGDVVASDYWDPISLGNSGVNLRFYRDITSDYIEYDITTDLTLTIKAVVQNYIDMENQLSKIVQEGY